VQERHGEIGALLATLLEFANIEDIDDIRVAEPLLPAVFLPK
jgi:hypothetical protein